MAEEQKTFPPSPEFMAQANIADPHVYDEAARDPQGWWAKQAETLLDLDETLGNSLRMERRPMPSGLSADSLNVAANCLDRHLTDGRRNKAALIFEGEPGDTRVLTYWDLHREVCKFANVLEGQGIKKGDRVTIYLPMPSPKPSSPCWPAPASAPSIRSSSAASAPTRCAERISRQPIPKLLITADGGWRRGNAPCV